MSNNPNHPSKKPDTRDTLVKVQAFREPQPYRSGFVIPFPHGHRLTFAFQADGPGGSFSTEPQNLAERINRAKADPVYAPFAEAAPNGRLGVIAAVQRGLVHHEEDSSEVLDLSWFEQVNDADSTIPEGGPLPQFHLYVKQTLVGTGSHRVQLFFRDPEHSAGCSLAFPAATGTDPATRQALQIFLAHMDDKPLACQELTALFLGGRRPSMDVFQWMNVNHALAQAKNHAAQSGSSMGGAWLGIFLVNYFRISRHFCGLADEALISPIDPRYALLDRHREAVILRYSQEKAYRLHTRVNETLAGPGDYIPGMQDLHLRHVPLFDLDDRDHHVTLGFGGRLDEDGGRRHTNRVVVRYLPSR